MGEHSFGKIIRKSGTYAVAVVASRALSFVLIPVYTRYLSTSDYGVLELLDLTMNFIVVFAGLRLGQALFYFYFSEDDPERRKRHMSTNVIASTALGVVVAMVAWFSSAGLSTFVFGSGVYAPLFRLTAVSIGLSIPMETFLCCLRTFDEPAMFAGIGIARTLVSGILNIVFLVGLRMGVRAMLWSAILSQAVVLAGLCVHIFRRVPARLDLRSLRQQAGYTFPLSIGAVGEFILNYGDRYFLRKAVTLSEIGIYSLAYKIGMLIPLVQYPFQLYWGSQEVKIVRQEGGWKIFTRVGTYLMLGLTAITVLVALFANPALQVMVGAGFRPAARYAGWIALAYLLRSAGGYCREIFVIDKRPDLEARVTWIATIVCFAGYALWIPRHGVWGAVWGTLAGFAVALVVSILIAKRVRKVDYEYGRLAKVALSAAAVTTIFAMTPAHSFWTQTALACGLTALFFVMLHALKFWRPAERQYVRAIIARYLPVPAPRTSPLSPP